MAVYRVGKFWWYKFRFNGKDIKKSTKQSNQRVAKDMEAARRVELAKSKAGIAEPKTAPMFKKAMADFLKWSEREHAAKPATHRRYVTSSVALLRYFGDVSLDNITAAEVERFKTERRGQFATARGKNGQRKQTKKQIKPATVNRELACLRLVFNHVIKDNVPVKNPVSKMGAKALQENNEQTRVLTLVEQEKYLAVATAMLWDIAMIILETGMRPEEVYRIQPENVHLAEGYLFNPYGKTKPAKRRIKLTATVASILARRISGAKGAYLFPHQDDPDQPVPKVNNAHDRVMKVLAASGVPHIRLYDFRHTWATRAVEAGVDLATLMAMMGHSRIQQVLRYAHPTQEHQTRAMDKIERHVAEQRHLLAEKGGSVAQTIQ